MSSGHSKVAGEGGAADGSRGPASAAPARGTKISIMKLIRVLCCLAGILLAAGLIAAPAQASPSLRINYVALGDSHASGVGLGDYDPASGDCLRSPHAYAPTWKAAYPGSFSYAACSGATTQDVNANQLGGLSGSTNLVTISIGGNDAGFSAVVGACRFGTTEQCDAAVDNGIDVITNVLPGRLDDTYGRIRAKAPNADVVVLGYPHLFELGATCQGDDIPEAHRARLNQAADVLATVTAQRVKAAGARFTFADTRPYFAGHGICSTTPWIHALRADQVESYHPNQAGHDNAYLKALNDSYDVVS
jgi:lysophospholipase L1-like esterase